MLVLMLGREQTKFMDKRSVFARALFLRALSHALAVLLCGTEIKCTHSQ